MNIRKRLTPSLPTTHYLRQDLLASIVVFLVALPLCMGIAIASGAPVATGLITGIVGGLIVGLLAGSPLQVSGPAAGLTVIVYEAIQRHGLEMLGLVVLMAGLLQLVAGLLCWGQWFRAVSPAVIRGMLAGIGVLIFASQFHVMVDDAPKGSGLQNLVTIPQAIQKSLAWPEMKPKEVREFKIRELRQVGELHRRQVRLQERVAEHIPDHKLPKEAMQAVVLSDLMDQETLDHLKSEQAAITEKLTSIQTEVDSYLSQDDASHHWENIHNAAATALAASHQAEEALEKGNLPGVLPAQSEAEEDLGGLLKQLKSHHLAAAVGVITILMIVGWKLLMPKKLQVLPATLMAIVLATAVAAIWSLPVLYVEVPNNLMEDITFPTISILQDAPWLGLLQSAIVIAIIASAETLLCATAVDQMHDGPRTRYDQELAAQGVGNMVCGFLGALPMTGVIVRSGANVQAGGKTRLSAILHGLWLLIFVVILGALLRMIPTASLAAMLVYTGYKLVDPKAIKNLKAVGWGEVVIYFATMIGIVVTDLLTGVLIGIGLSGLKLLYTFSHLRTRLVEESAQEKQVTTLCLEGAATFIRLPKLAAVLDRVPPSSELHVDFQHLSYIDHACLELLTNWATQHSRAGGKLVIDWDSLHARFRSDRRNGNGSQTPTPKPAEAVEVKRTA